jgi:trans-aconitate methyltransferase
MAAIEYSGRDNLDVMAHAKNYNRFLLDLVLQNAHPDQSIVDFGAGNGTFAGPIAKSHDQIMCIETDPTLCAALKSQGLTVVNDLAQLADGSVDYLYSLNVLEHIEDDEAIAALWFKKLRSGGQILVFVPAFQFLFTSMDQHVGHHRRYTRTSLTRVIQKAQFQITDSYYADSVGVLATLLYKALDQGGGQVNVRMLRIYDQWCFPISRIFDRITKRFIGKNAIVRAIKPA